MVVPVKVNWVVRLVRLSVSLTPVSSIGDSLNSVGAAKPSVLMTRVLRARSGLTLPARSIRRTAKLL